MKRSAHQSGGLRLSVAETGTGAPFIFQHGLCGDASQPAQVFPLDTAFRCVTVECRGHGLSETGSKNALSIETFADDITGYIERSNMVRPVLGGISMGAAISIRIAVRSPGLIKALVIARPAWLADPAPDNMRPNALAGDLLGRMQPTEARLAFEDSEIAACLEVHGPDNLNSIRGFFSRQPIDVTAALLSGISADGPGVSEDEIQRISVPTLVIGHERDAVHPISHARTLAAWIPDARFVEITPKAESPAAYRADFQAALATFLNEV
ncbi:alpha/beta hydrolase [Mesorhizobium sp. AR07]|uniref:alpha/beta fold hydrolase n=1 Tax=Mesorhizobium sp. AR07 TaxID=2865838 RepID=UPI00215F1B7B|nr:alpha/beta hydrolase [Mesorhizobium sp. AR07]UVK44008.1 alpha/beta hydrolase [Mesorhizobium sp. AR07]